MHADVHPVLDEATHTLSCVVKDPTSPACAIIDSVLDFDYASGRTHTRSADALAAIIQSRGWTVEWIIETHVHADHLSAAPYLQQKLGGKTGIGENITGVQNTFARIFNEGSDFRHDGSQFDRLFREGDTFTIGRLGVQVLHTPGHTPACLTYMAGDAAFVGDTLFMPDAGTARCDFPGGSAAMLYASIQKILSLPDATRIFVCHDYGAPGRDRYAWESTVAEQKAHNIHIHGGICAADFVEMRQSRDATLAMPRLIIPALQINMRAGQMPPAQSNGITYLKVPLNAL